MRDCYLILVKNKCLSNNDFFVIKYIQYKLNIKNDLMLRTVLSGIVLRNYFELRSHVKIFLDVWTKTSYLFYDIIRYLNRDPSAYV
jgi:hypothetical protein